MVAWLFHGAAFAGSMIVVELVAGGLALAGAEASGIGLRRWPGAPF